MAVLSDDQAMLRDAARAWARERAPLASRRALTAREAPLGYEPALYAEMAAMGWAGVGVPEAQGGVGLGLFEAGLILEALGRTLVASPLAGTGAAAVTALRVGGNQSLAAAWLPQIAAGKAVVALAVDGTAHHAPDAIVLAAERQGEGWLLRGTKRTVVDGMAADALLVVARAADGVALFLVPADAPGLSRRAQRQIDGGVVATVEFEGVRIGAEAALGRPGDDRALVDRMLDAARAALAAEMLGTAEAAFQITLDYLKVRTQFGQPIGSFQALQHRAVDMLGELALTRSAVERALVALDADAPDRAALVSLAKLFASQTSRLVSDEMIQMHGGIGMTEEHDAGLFLKRARVAAFLYGGEAFHRERYGALTGH